MLIGIPALLGPDFLSTLRAMGHGDELAIVDGNYPANEHARRILRADGHSIIDVMEAVLTVLPVDDDVPQALFCASVGGDPTRLDPVHHDMIALCARRAPRRPVVPLPGPAFYARVKAAYAVVATSEPRLYANFIVRKGVIRPWGASEMIVCCGEALIDMLPRRSTMDEPAFAPYSGGAVFNTAIALGRLGVPVEFFSGLSSDLFGQQLRATLAESKVGSRYAHVSGRPTTLAFVHLVDGHASYVFYDEGTAGRMLSIADLPVLEGNVDAMLFGAISLIPEPSGAAYEALMQREAPNRVTMLDPNIRPAFIPDRGKHLARIQRMIAMADILKLSDEDLSWFGTTGAPEDAISQWLDLGPKLIVMTRGSQGATGYTKTQKVTVTPKPVRVVDTVGAGDTFNAGILASLHDQGALSKGRISNLSETAIREALSLGATAAAVTVSRAGANPPWRRELG